MNALISSLAAALLVDELLSAENADERLARFCDETWLKLDEALEYGERLNEVLEWDWPEQAALVERVTGLQFLGMGQKRVVLALSDGRVLKLDMRRDRYQDNLSEVRLWKQAKGTLLEELLVPVLLYSKDGRWLIMDRAIPLDAPLHIIEAGPIPPKEFLALVGRPGDVVVRITKDLLWVAPGLRIHEDVHEGNVGWHAGRPKLLDYNIWADSEGPSLEEAWKLSR